VFCPPFPSFLFSDMIPDFFPLQRADEFLKVKADLVLLLVAEISSPNFRKVYKLPSSTWPSVLLKRSPLQWSASQKSI